jgi:hypothetical protein
MRFNLIAAGALLVGALGGCSSSAQDAQAQRFCPPGVVVTDAANLTRFKPGAGRDPTDVQFQAEIGKVETKCDFSRRGGVSIDMRVAIVVNEGPAALNRTAQMAYFVAIIAPGRQVVARKEFPADYTFAGNRNRVIGLEELTQSIPGITDVQAQGYQVAVGFVLTQDELNYNRQRKR